MNRDAVELSGGGGVRGIRARLGPTGARLRHIGLAPETCQGGPEGLGSIPNHPTTQLRRHKEERNVKS